MRALWRGSGRLTSSATGSEAPPDAIARGIGLGVVAGAVAIPLAVLVGAVAWGGLSFLLRVDLLDPASGNTWLNRVIGLLGYAVVGVAIRFGVAGAAPATPTARRVGAVVAGLGAGILLGGSAFWPAVAVGVGWGIGIGRSPVRITAAAGIGLVVGLVGLTFEAGALTDAVVLGTIGAVAAGVLIVAAAAVDRLVADPADPGPDG